jgi:hypothetical protein
VAPGRASGNTGGGGAVAPSRARGPVRSWTGSVGGHSGSMRGAVSSPIDSSSIGPRGRVGSRPGSVGGANSGGGAVRRAARGGGVGGGVDGGTGGGLADRVVTDGGGGTAITVVDRGGPLAGGGSGSGAAAERWPRSAGSGAAKLSAPESCCSLIRAR